MLAQKGRIDLKTPVRAWVEEAFSNFPVHEPPLNREIALLSREVDLPHQDPADRFLAATALVYEFTMMTMDQRLLKAEWLPTFTN